jgi:hypothetical protein
MALTQVTGPYPIFTDLDGTPLDDGYLYIGEVNQDPETNPVQVYWDSALTIAATQPIRTNNGYAYRNGTPALIYTAGAFSITIRNKREEFVLYSPVGYGFDPGAVSASVVKNDFTGNGVQVAFVLSAAPSTILATNIFINGVYQEKDSYTLAGNTITFSVAPPLSSSIEVMTNETGVINSGNATAISYTAGLAGATAQTVQTKLEQYVSVEDFGAVGDGVANDTVALAAAIAYQQSSGCTLGLVSGKTYNVSTWSTLTLSNPFYLEGQNATLRCSNATRVAFVICQDTTKITNTIFDGWYRIVNNTTAVTQTIDNFEFIGNTCINATAGANNFAYYVLLQNPVNRVFIDNNRFFDAKTAAIYVGDNVYANQDTWQNITVSNNFIDGVSIDAGPSQIFGILVYGRDVLISGNSVKDVECAAGAYSASNGAYGIYTKSRYTRIVNNTVHNIGVVNLNADADQLIGINVKGTNRGVTSAPNGYSSLVEGNTVENIGAAGTYGTGVSMDHNGVIVTGNWIESGRYGVLAADPIVASNDGLVITSNHITVGAGANSRGIEIATYDTHTVLGENVINAGGTGNCIRIRSVSGVLANAVVNANSFRNCGVALFMSADTFNVSNITITDNILVSGTHGVFMNTSGGGAYTDITIMDNDFSAASTAGIAGAGISATTRIRNNRGYVSENGGATASISTAATVSHGCASTPTSVIITALGIGPTDAYVSAIGATTFTINFGGGGSQAFAWEAKVSNYFAA